MKLKLTSKNLLLATILLVAGLFLTSQVMAFEGQAQVTAPAIVNASSITIQVQPDPNAAISDVVGQNQVVTMLGRNADASWVYVRTPNNVLGWTQPQGLTYTINLFNLTVVTAPGTTVTPVATSTATAVAATQTPAPPPSATGTVNTGALNVRSGPGVQYSRIAAVYFGDAVVLLGRNSDTTWLNIRTANNVVGWVNARYITTAYPITSLPVTSTTGSTPTPVPPGATAVPTTAPSGPAPNSAVVNTGNLNVRSGPGVGYPRVTSVSIGTTVSLFGRNLDTSWVSVGTPNGQQGWVNSKFLNASSNMSNLPVTSQTGTGYVATGNLNVRSAPSATASVVTTVPYGSAVTLLGRSSDNTWLMVHAFDGKEGWVNAAFISTAMNISQLPVLTGAVPGQPPVPPANPGNTTSLRSCPNITCAVSGTVYSGLAVTATGRTADNTWVYVVLSNGQQGWIQAQFVALAVPISSLPVTYP
jgi:uncharacterized protein YgiM (DUF1202 family)